MVSGFSGWGFRDVGVQGFWILGFRVEGFWI